MNMEIRWSKSAISDLEYWKKEDKTKINKIKMLLESIIDTPYEGLGKPEPLKYEWSGYWSRRISREHRLVYKYNEDFIEVIACRYHYTKG